MKGYLFVSTLDRGVVHLPSPLCDIVFSLLIQLIVMASSDDTEGSLTPVDFIQLQHYMECKSHLVIKHHFSIY